MLSVTWGEEGILGRRRWEDAALMPRTGPGSIL